MTILKNWVTSEALGTFRYSLLTLWHIILRADPVQNSEIRVCRGGDVHTLPTCCETSWTTAIFASMILYEMEIMRFDISYCI